MERTQIEQKLLGLLHKDGHLEDTSSLKPEASLKEDLCMDSLDTVEFIMAVEEEFNIEISDEESDKILTVGEVLDFIESKC